jgi:outer membrane protein OmpA-like peptidoglycan-associated protein
MVDRPENILVEFDYNNIIVVDPNKVINEQGVAQQRLVRHEDLVIYANLETKVLPRTKLAVGVANNDIMQTVSIATINFLKPGGNTFLDTKWTDELTGKDAVKGDRIYLEKVLFERGSSQLTVLAKKELDKIAVQLLKFKNIQFEIQGHVCCTPTYHREAVDRETKKRELSVNRAKRVYNYLFKKGISDARMTYRGYGNTQSLKQGGALDRRVELLILKNEASAAKK